MFGFSELHLNVAVAMRVRADQMHHAFISSSNRTSTCSIAK